MMQTSLLIYFLFASCTLIHPDQDPEPRLKGTVSWLGQRRVTAGFKLYRCYFLKKMISMCFFSVNANPPPISCVVEIFTQAPVICNRDPLLFWPLDPGLVFPDPGAPILTSIGTKYLRILWLQKRLDPGSEVRDPGWIEISPDPQHFLALITKDKDH